MANNVMKKLSNEIADQDARLYELPGRGEDIADITLPLADARIISVCLEQAEKMAERLGADPLAAEWRRLNPPEKKSDCPPCPWCGSPATLIQTDDETGYWRCSYDSKIRGCAAGGPGVTTDENGSWREKAIATMARVCPKPHGCSTVASLYEQISVSRGRAEYERDRANAFERLATDAESANRVIADKLSRAEADAAKARSDVATLMNALEYTKNKECELCPFLGRGDPLVDSTAKELTDIKEAFRLEREESANILEERDTERAAWSWFVSVGATITHGKGDDSKPGPDGAAWHKVGYPIGDDTYAYGAACNTEHEAVVSAWKRYHNEGQSAGTTTE